MDGTLFIIRMQCGISLSHFYVIE